MKNQRFRFRLITLLLIGLIALAAFCGARTIPVMDSSASLRDAILRLTGQNVPAGPAATPSSAYSTEGLVFSPSSPAPSSSPSAFSVGNLLFTGLSPSSSPVPDPSPADQKDLSLPEALSQYFSSVSPDPAASPSPFP